MSSPESLLLGQASEILLLVDAASLEIRAASPAALAELGYTQETLLGRPITDIECALSDVFFWEDVRQGGNPKVDWIEGLYQRADGSTLAVSKRVRRIDEGTGWLVVSAHGIEGEKRAEEELAHMTSQLRATLEATVDGILLLDRHGRIANMNRRFAELWRVPQDILIEHEDRLLKQFLISRLAENDPFAEHLSRIASDSESENFDTLYLADGRVFECKSRPAHHAEQIIGRVFSFTDVTERHAAEQAMIAARDAATAASRAKGEFLAMMSHEIRTPMNGILGVAELLGDTPLNPEQADYVRTMRSSCEALLGIINDILDYSKIEARKLELESVSFNLPAMLDDIGKLFRVRTREQGLGYDCLIGSSIPSELMGDPVRLRQILVNLVGNAIKFTEHGSIEVTVRELERDDERVRLRFGVRDSGIGIPADKLEHIFSPFEQADMSTTRRFGGTGLGLSICRMLTELMGGEIGVDSAAGRGSEFWFSIPLRVCRDTQATLAQFAAPTICLAPQTRVLVVEDNPVNLMVITRLLSKLGVTTPSTASTGIEALQAHEDGSFDLILMDTRMPEMDGLVATRRLREQGVKTYIIGVSADASLDDRSSALATGMDDYLTKPVSLEALNRALTLWQTQARG